MLLPQRHTGHGIARRRGRWFNMTGWQSWLKIRRLCASILWQLPDELSAYHLYHLIQSNSIHPMQSTVQSCYWKAQVISCHQAPLLWWVPEGGSVQGHHRQGTCILSKQCIHAVGLLLICTPQKNGKTTEMHRKYIYLHAASSEHTTYAMTIQLRGNADSRSCWVKLKTILDQKPQTPKANPHLNQLKLWPLWEKQLVPLLGPDSYQTSKAASLLYILYYTLIMYNYIILYIIIIDKIIYHIISYHFMLYYIIFPGILC